MLLVKGRTGSNFSDFVVKPGWQTGEKDFELACVFTEDRVRKLTLES